MAHTFYEVKLVPRALATEDAEVALCTESASVGRVARFERLWCGSRRRRATRIVVNVFVENRQGAICGCNIRRFL